MDITVVLDFIAKQGIPAALLFGFLIVAYKVAPSLVTAVNKNSEAQERIAEHVGLMTTQLEGVRAEMGDFRSEMREVRRELTEVRRSVGLNTDERRAA